MLSQNGYRSRDVSLIATYTIAHNVKISLRKGDASVVLLHFARWYDSNIEQLTSSDTGGYNPRSVTGTPSVDSNHASGTAMDLRWNKHVRGKHNTFTAAQKKKIHDQLKFYEGAIRWGGDYSSASVIDEMHFEINVGATKLAQIAKKCKEGSSSKPAAKPTVQDHVVVDGDLGPLTIAKWQSVTKQTVTGKMTPTFVKWLQAFLKERVDHRLDVDGIVGKLTISALQRYLKAPVDGIIADKNSTTVIALQRRINAGSF